MLVNSQALIPKNSLVGNAERFQRIVLQAFVKDIWDAFENYKKKWHSSMWKLKSPIIRTFFCNLKFLILALLPTQTLCKGLSVRVHPERWGTAISPSVVGPSECQALGSVDFSPNIFREDRNQALATQMRGWCGSTYRVDMGSSLALTQEEMTTALPL